MFEVLMQKNGYRVDYFEQNAQTPNSFAFYVCGRLKMGECYSSQAKRNLYAGLSVFARNNAWKHLAAVYLDVCGESSKERKAYLQLKADVRAGMFTKVFVMRLEDLASSTADMDELRQLEKEVKGFEVCVLQKGEFNPSEPFKILPIVA